MLIITITPEGLKLPPNERNFAHIYIDHFPVQSIAQVRPFQSMSTHTHTHTLIDKSRPIHCHLMDESPITSKMSSNDPNIADQQLKTPSRVAFVIVFPPIISRIQDVTMVTEDQLMLQT